MNIPITANGASRAIASHSVARLNIVMKKVTKTKRKLNDLMNNSVQFWAGGPISWRTAIKLGSFISNLKAMYSEMKINNIPPK